MYLLGNTIFEKRREKREIVAIGAVDHSFALLSTQVRGLWPSINDSRDGDAGSKKMRKTALLAFVFLTG